MTAIREYHRRRFPNDRLHILRYNPHTFKQDGIVKKPSVDERTLSIQACLSHVLESDFTITYLFYRLFDSVPAVTLDSSFSLRDFVRTVCCGIVRTVVEAIQCDINVNATFEQERLVSGTTFGLNKGVLPSGRYK